MSQFGTHPAELSANAKLTCVNIRLAGASMLSAWMPNVSSFGGEIDNVIYLILYVVGFFFVVAEGLLLYFAIASRRKSPNQAHYNRGNTPREAAWIIRWQSA